MSCICRNERPPQTSSLAEVLDVGGRSRLCVVATNLLWRPRCQIHRYPEFSSSSDSRRPFHPTRDGSLGKVKTEHEEFPMYPRRSPGRVLSDHPKDQLANLLRRPSSSNLRPNSNSGDPPPVHTKTCPMPADNSFRCDDDQGLFPIRGLIRRRNKLNMARGYTRSSNESIVVRC